MPVLPLQQGQQIAVAITHDHRCLGRFVDQPETSGRLAKTDAQLGIVIEQVDDFLFVEAITAHPVELPEKLVEISGGQRSVLHRRQQAPADLRRLAQVPGWYFSRRHEDEDLASFAQPFAIAATGRLGDGI
jgi:hypothetical protein